MHRIIEEDAIQIIKDNEITKLKNKTILITGATGMIGSYFVNTLIVANEKYQMNINILALVRNKNKFANYILNNPKVTILEQDVIKPINYDGPIDYIIHAASPASPKLMKDYPYETNIANTIGTYNTLNLALEKKSLGYLFVSSREIYGQPQEKQDIFTEDGPLGQVNPLIPRNGYAEGKKAAENMCISAKSEYGLNVKVVRLAHTYGPGMSIDDGRVQADFLKNVLNHENIIMKSTGASVRTYTYVSDAINAMFKVLLSSEEAVYNISDENSKVTIKQLAEILAEISEDNIKVIMDIPKEELNKGGNSVFTLGILSSKKIREELNWKPMYDIRNGFLRTIDYLKDNRK